MNQRLPLNYGQGRTQYGGFELVQRRQASPTWDSGATAHNTRSNYAQQINEKQHKTATTQLQAPDFGQAHIENANCQLLSLL